VHLQDGFVSGPLNVAAAAVSAGALRVALNRAARTLRDRTVPLLGVVAAFVFAAQMLNFPVAGGVSGHFVGAVFAAVLLGPGCAVLVMAVVLLLQCLLFADGGITALGTNLLNMGLVAGLGGYGIFRLLQRMLPDDRRGFLAAAAFASWCSVPLAAAACAVELAFSGTAPLGLVLPALLGTHAVIGVGEAAITWLILALVLDVRPDLLDAVPGDRRTVRFEVPATSSAAMESPERGRAP
jgi:cobalt/nickel transport system permease protein